MRFKSWLNLLSLRQTGPDHSDNGMAQPGFPKRPVIFCGALCFLDFFKNNGTLCGTEKA